MTIEVTAVEGRKVVFAVTAKDDLDTVSSGSHARFVVDKAKTVERLKAKAAKLASRPAS
jgi:predicted thioesterase